MFTDENFVWFFGGMLTAFVAWAIVEIWNSR
jgi:hypothetical protein